MRARVILLINTQGLENGVIGLFVKMLLQIQSISAILKLGQNNIYSQVFAG